jgi:hypothetical protein
VKWLLFVALSAVVGSIVGRYLLPMTVGVVWYWQVCLTLGAPRRERERKLEQFIEFIDGVISADREKGYNPSQIAVTVLMAVMDGLRDDLGWWRERVGPLRTTIAALHSPLCWDVSVAISTLGLLCYCAGETNCWISVVFVSYCAANTFARLRAQYYVKKAYQYVDAARQFAVTPSERLPLYRAWAKTMQRAHRYMEPVIMPATLDEVLEVLDELERRSGSMHEQRRRLAAGFIKLLDRAPWDRELRRGRIPRCPLLLK